MFLNKNTQLGRFYVYKRVLESQNSETYCSHISDQRDNNNGLKVLHYSLTWIIKVLYKDDNKI